MADGTISIDFLLNDKTAAQFEDFKQKAAQAGDEAYKSAKKPFDSAIVAKLEAQAKKEGITNFKDLLEQLPKKQATELLAKANSGEAIDFVAELKKIPSKVLSQMELNDDASPKLQNIQKEASNTETKMGSLKSTIAGTFLGNAAFKAFDMGLSLVKDSLDGAINRVDILNNSNRAYENMGVKAEDAAKANKDLQKAIDGLPTSLDAAVKGQQLLTASMNNDIGGATDVFRAINDSILGFGGNANQVNEAVVQLSQSFSNGKVDAATWNSMINAGMGPALNSLAKTMGMTAGELKDGMSTGKVSAEDFQKALVNLDKNGGGGMTSLQKIAKDSTSGIGTSMENMKTAFTRVLANLLDGLQKSGLSDAFDGLTKAIKGTASPMEALGRAAGGLLKFLMELIGPVGKILGAFASGVWDVMADVVGGISKAFDNLSKSMGGAAKNGNPVANVLKEIGKHTDVIKALGTVVGVALAGLAAYKALIYGIRGAMLAWSTAVKVVTGVIKILNLIMNANPIGLIIAAIALLVVGLFELYKHFKPFRELVDGLAKYFVNAFKDMGKVLDTFVKGIQKTFSSIGKGISSGISAVGKFFSNLGKAFQSGWNAFIKVVGKLFEGIGKVLLYALLGAVGVVAIFGTSLYKAFSPIFKPIVEFVKTVFSGMGKAISNSLKEIQRIFTNVWNAIVKFFKPIINWFGEQIDNEVKGWQIAFKTVCNFINNVFRAVWNGLVKFFKPIIEWFGDVISTTIDAVKKAWEDVWNAISDFFTGIWHGITKFIDKSMNSISDTISSVLDNIGKTWNNMWQGLSDFFGQIWSNIKGFAQDGINGVLDVINSGVDAIDSVWKFFTGHETSIHHLKHVKFASGGVVGDSEMAMINDGGGSNWKELLQFPNGEVKMSDKRNHVLPLPKGTRVYNGEETKNIMDMAGVKKYADGGIVGGLIDWGKGTFDSMANWVGDKYDAVVGFLKDPVKNVTNMITKATAGMYDGLHSFGDMAHGVWDNLNGSIADWFKKELEKVKELLKRSAPAGSGVERWRDQVKDALAANGMSTESWAVEKILRQISSESSGNEKAVQGGYTDVNTLSGDLAKGLMQTISATFNAYAFPGHTDIFNGYDNLLASINYIKHRYGYGMAGIGEGHGYANGGRTNGIGVVGEVPGEDEWVTNPNRPSADSSIIGSIRETAQKQPNSFSAKLAKVVDNVKSGIGSMANQPTLAANGNSFNGGGLNLSGDVTMTVQLDSGDIAQATYPKIKMLQNQDIQLRAQARGSIYGS